MRFAQIIEFSTTRFDEFERLLDDWLSQTEGSRTATRGIETRDRDRANTYLQIIEFPSYEAAMANSALPATTQSATTMAKLCDAPPIFRNLDILRENNL
jgi:hypothetical protein